MQVRLPQEDEEDNLHEPVGSIEGMNRRGVGTRREESQEMPLKFFIIAGLAVVVIIILFYSSHQKVSIVYTPPFQDKPLKTSTQTNTAKANPPINAHPEEGKPKVETGEKHGQAKAGKEKDQNNEKPVSFNDELKDLIYNQGDQENEKSQILNQKQNAKKQKEKMEALPRNKQLPKIEEKDKRMNERPLPGAPKPSNERKQDKTTDQRGRFNQQQKHDEPASKPDKNGDQNPQNIAAEIQKMKELMEKKMADLEKAKQTRHHENPQQQLRKNAQKNRANPAAKPNYQNNQFAFSPETMIKQEHKQEPVQPKQEKKQENVAPVAPPAPKEEIHDNPPNPPKPLNNPLAQPSKERPIPGKRPQPSVPKTRQQLQARKVIPIPPKQKQVVNVQRDPMMMTPPPRGNFVVPHFVWTYSENLFQNSFFVKKCLDNIKYYAKKSSYEVNVLNFYNYKTFLKPETVEKITKVISMLNERMTKEPNSNLKDHFETIKKRLITLHILNEKGGIFIEKNVLFTESFEWLKEIEDNIYVNKGSGRVRGRYFAFFDMDHGSLLEKHNKFGIVYDTEKYMIQFPGIEPYFFVAQANQQFLTETLVQYIDLLTNPSSLDEKLKKYQLNMGALQGKDLYYEILYICQHIVLHRKQQQLNKLGANKDDNNFAIDYYGLLTMNERYFPKKLQFTFENHAEEKVYWNLAKYTLQEMEDTTGPMRYIMCMMFEEHINYRLEKANQNEERYYIHPDSFLGKYVINDNSQPYILKEYEKSVVNPQGKTWEKLPRIIWIYWDSGINNSSLGNRLCVDNIKRVTLSKFEIRQLNDSNAAQYLGTYLNNKIDNFIKNAKITTYAQTKSDFLRIAIMAKYGGIYMDASYFSVMSFDWIVNIAQAPSETIFNRYGQIPRVLLFFHPHFGNAFDWTYDKQANTKKLMLSAYENNLLIAEPNQQIFWDWLEEYGRFLTTPYEQSEELMKNLNVIGDRWTSKDNVYLAAMDSIKNVIAKRNKELTTKMEQDKNYKGPKSAAQFYGIWSISGYRGQQKFRAHTNFDNTYYSKPHNSDNVFLWRYSDNYVRGIIGKVSNLAKLYGWNIKYINNFLLSSYDSNFTSELHPISYFAKYLYNPFRHKITKHGNELSLEFLK